MVYKRELFPILQQQIKSKEIIIITGMRRVGKTTILKKIYDQIDSQNKVFLDIENPFSRSIFEEQNYDNIWANLSKFGITKTKKSYIFLDEIQVMPEIVKAVKYLYDHYNVKFFLTGSSSYYLKNLFPESLAGRKFVFELFPLNFREFLTFKEKSKEFQPNLSKAVKLKNKVSFEMYDKLLEEYIEWGGFPEVVLEKDIINKKLKLNDVFKSYFEQDVKGLADFGDLSRVRDFILLLMRRVGTKLDISKISSEMGVSRPTLYSYLSFLESTYFISLLSPFSKSVDREVSGANKVYMCDTGLLNAFSKVSHGSVLENCVFNNIKRYGKKFNYFEKRKGGEIDFIIDEKIALEVKNKAVIQDIKKLSNFANTLKLKQFFVASKEYTTCDKTLLIQDL